MPLSAFLIEDDPRIRENLGILLADVLDAKVVGMAETSDDALAWFASNEGHWDVAVLDLFLKEGTGFNVLTQMDPAHRRHCVVLTNSATPANIARCINLGADAVFDKSLQIDEFLNYCARLPAAQNLS
jgi:two-component system OmpR family response regulator